MAWPGEEDESQFDDIRTSISKHCVNINHRKLVQAEKSHRQSNETGRKLQEQQQQQQPMEEDLNRRIERCCLCHTMCDRQTDRIL